MQKDGLNWLDPQNQDTSFLEQILNTGIVTEFTSDFEPPARKTRHQQLSLLD